MKIKAAFSFQLFPQREQDSPNGYYICLYRNIDTGKKFTCKGYHLPRHKNLQYMMDVVQKPDPKRGMQYEMLSYEDYVEPTQASIVQYLSCGMIKGIGEKTAQKIYNHFGENTMKILEEDMDQLLVVPGITKKKLEAIRKSFVEKQKYKELTTFLLKFHFTITQIKHIIAHYKTDPLEAIRENPYSMIFINGIDFQKIEPVAKELGIRKDDIRRIQAAAIQVLKNTMTRGNTCMERHQFTHQLERLLDVTTLTKKTLQPHILALLKDHTLYYRKKVLKDGNIEEYFFLPACVRAEYDIAQEVLRMREEQKRSISKIHEKILNHARPLILDASQMEAIKMALKEPISIITGGPGTGKSTIVRIICDLFEVNRPGKQIYLASPTGRAARRMEECTNRHSQTIHHLLGLGIDSHEGADSEVILENALVIIDEFSMVDLFLTKKLFKSLRNCQLVLVGDSHQLPSVGPGSVLRELIRSKAIPCVELDRKHRQKEGSLIIDNANKLLAGDSTLMTGEEFSFIEESNLEKIEEQMIEETIKAVREKGLSNVLCLCPFREHSAGVSRMNRILQARLNPDGLRWEKTNQDYRIGDPVMQLRNMEDVSNGDIGYVTGFLDKNEEPVMEITFFGTLKKEYKVEDLADLDLAYAMTIHKSQGSEAACVITCLTNYHYWVLGEDLRLELPYTAITRGQSEVMFLGNKNALEAAMKSKKERVTLLSYEIKRQLKERQPTPPVSVYEQLKIAL